MFYLNYLYINMVTFQDALSAVTVFLNEAQNIGLIKEFCLTLLDESKEDFPGADELITKLLSALNKVPVTADCNDSCMDVNVVDVDEDKNKDANADSDKSSMPPPAPPPKSNLVQIQVDATEMKRRISAFISRKRKEVDEWNVQEFCSRPYIEEQNPMWEETDSCARVDTVFVPRSGSKSHVKVSRVENRWGPQTHQRVEAKQIKKEPGEETEDQSNSASLHAVEERLQNMEYHLKLKTESSRTNIFQRLKELEDRILFLEGISPDYLHGIPATDYQSPKKKFHYSDKEKLYSSWSVDDVQKRIQVLKESLKMKAEQFKQEPVS